MKITIQITALIILIYKDHLSIKTITNFMAKCENTTFSFSKVFEVVKKIKNLNHKKATQSYDIPKKLIKEYEVKEY